MNLATSISPVPDRSSPLKIALLGYRSHPHVGGQGIYLRFMSRALVDMGHTVDVYSGPPYPQLDSRVKLIKIPSLDLYAHPKPTRALRWQHLRSWSDSYEWWSKLSGSFAEPYTFGRRLLKIIPRRYYDVIHDNQSLCKALLTLQKEGERVVSTIHHPIHRDRDFARSEANGWGHRLLVNRWYGFIDMQERVAAQLRHLITVSKTSQGDISAHFKRQQAHCPVIHNGIDTDFFCPDKPALCPPYQILSTASSDQPLKGLHILLPAIARVRKNIPALELVIIGRLKPEGSSEKLLKELGLDTCVKCLSGIDDEAVRDAYRRASVFVCPSLYEGFGLPIAEAMACGKAVISSDGGALPEVVGDAGVLVPAGDIEALSSAIENLLLDDDARTQLGNLARRRVVNHFSWAEVAKKLTDYYHSMLNERVSSR
jgi:glycosyltransferase involved in cell wall biosynthesis